MLSWLAIRGLALVESVELELDPGLNVLTGETGAGKSLVLGSINLLLGERADADWLRTGESKGWVEAIFDLEARPDLQESLRAIGVEVEEDRLVLRREVQSDGKSRAFVNGRAALVGQLKAVGELLVDLHGQHEHQMLLRPERQTEFFDAWAGLQGERLALEAERAALSEARAELRTARERWERDRAEESALREDLGELQRAVLDPDEEERLLRDRQRLKHRERLLHALSEARSAIGAEEGGALGTARRADRALRLAAAADPSLLEAAQEAERVVEDLARLESRLEREESHILDQPMDIESVEERLDLLHRLKRKHRSDVQGLLALRDALATRVSALDPGSRNLERAEREHDERVHAYERRLDVFLEHRRDRFEAFERETAARLSRLGLHRAALRVRPAETDRARAAVDPPQITGLEFALQPNPGEGERPLRRIASGGELSRIMLAIKSLMAERDRVAVLVFDEVDQGIGGAVAEEVGRLLRALGGRRQVLCITHLPLIAAQGSRHFEVSKATHGRRTSISVRRLGDREREAEVARLLAGDRVSETTRKQARELLATAGGAPVSRPRARRTAGSRT